MTSSMLAGFPKLRRRPQIPVSIIVLIYIVGELKMKRVVFYFN